MNKTVQKYFIPDENTKDIKLPAVQFLAGALLDIYATVSGFYFVGFVLMFVAALNFTHLTHNKFYKLKSDGAFLVALFAVIYLMEIIFHILDNFIDALY